MTHELEELFFAPSSDIMDAILKGFRAQVDVKGKLAELYLDRYLTKLLENKKIESYEWIDIDGRPDFEITFHGRTFLVECKNLRNEVYKKPNLAYKVEIQKTRNSKDGSNTRSYKVNYFDILAICMFNQTKKWDFRFIKSSDLMIVEGDSDLLKVMQRVPTEIDNPWKDNVINVLEKCHQG